MAFCSRLRLLIALQLAAVDYFFELRASSKTLASTQAAAQRCALRARRAAGQPPREVRASREGHHRHACAPGSAAGARGQP